MKKHAIIQPNDEQMQMEYDFTGGVRGKPYHDMHTGYTITIHHEDGRTEVKEVIPLEGAILLDPDVRVYFPDSVSVNTALRNLIQLIPSKHRELSEYD